jgi:hypothetical protein
LGFIHSAELAVSDTAFTTHPQHAPTPPVPLVIAGGAIGGAALGVIARAWMRLISDSPEFTIGGTLFIIGGFTFFGLMQSIVVVVRRRPTQRWKLTTVRAAGVVAMMPLFIAAGAVMFPTVMGAGLARARTDWNKWLRALLALVALGPIGFVARDLVHDFGWSPRALVGLLGLLAVYTAIVWVTWFAFAPQDDGWHLTRRVRLILCVLAPLVFVVALIGGGGIK